MLAKHYRIISFYRRIQIVVNEVTQLVLLAICKIVFSDTKYQSSENKRLIKSLVS